MQVKVLSSENQIYHKQKLLGQGAFGKAYLVTKKQTGEKLVIKEMNIDHMSKAERQQTIKQAQILRTFGHPGIVKFVEVYVTKQNNLKIVMQYAECGDLSKAIAVKKSQKKFFEQNQILDWFTQICLAMKHVHDRKVLHRDIKGQNIFVTKNNTLKLGDFGIAKVLNKTNDKARTVVGTPYYLSPQLIQNKPYSFKSDIWSMGVLLYEICALTHPFTATSLQMLALKIVKGSYPSLQANYSKQLKSLVSQLLQTDWNKRPTVGEILKKPFIQNRIKNFLSETSHKNQFSHTLLHNHKIDIANKFVKKQSQEPKSRDEIQRIQKERARLKQDQARLLQQKMERRKFEEKRKQEQKYQKKIEDDRRRRQAADRRDEQRRRQVQKREQDKRKWLEKQKARDEEQRQRRRVYEIAQMGRKRERDEKQKQKREVQLFLRRQDLVRQKQDIERARKKQAKKEQKNKQQQSYAEIARQQYFENQMIRKKAEQRARQENSSNYDSRQNSVQRYEQDKDNSKSYQSNKNIPPKRQSQIKEEELLYPNYGQRKEKNTQYNRSKQRPKTYSNNNSIKSAESEAKKASYEDARQKMKKDREEFSKKRNGNKVDEICSELKQAEVDAETLKPAKWGKKSRSSSREIQEKVETDNTEETFEQVEMQQPSKKPKLQSSIDMMNSKNLKLNIKDQEQFNNYLDELQGLLQNVNKNIQQKQQQQQPFSEMPVQQQVIYRQQDSEQLDYSMTGSFDPLLIEKPNNQTPKNQIEADNVDLNYFSDYSKLEELRMSLEDKFGTDSFVQIYKSLEKQLQTKGLQEFNIIEVTSNFEDPKTQMLLTENVPMLLTLIIMQQKMMSC